MNRLQDWLRTSGFDGIIISRRDNFTWLANELMEQNTASDGNAMSQPAPSNDAAQHSIPRNWVLSNATVGIASLYIPRMSNDHGDNFVDRSGNSEVQGDATNTHSDGNRILLIADSIDGSRILEEELGGSSIIELKQYPWLANADDFCRDIIGDNKIASDTGIAGTINVQADLVEIRSILNEREQQTYRRLGRKCAEIVEGVCRVAIPGMTENHVANLVKQHCIAAGISPDCVLVGSDERIMKYRHPMPTEQTIDKLLMIVLGAEQAGLNVSLTRFVSFGQPSAEQLDRLAKTQKIFAEMQGLMEAGLPYATYFQQVQKLYAAADCPDEWQKHHQGGPTGYACREKIVTPNSTGHIKLNQAYAWNPSITGAKAEDTTLLTSSNLEILTRTNDWPTTVFQTANGPISVADILVR